MGTPEEIAASTTSDTLFEAWTTPDVGRRSALTRDLAVPGEVALRARLHFLRGLSTNGRVPVQTLSRADWDSVIAAESRGDSLLAQGSALAGACFQDLLALDDPWPDLVGVHALIGLADVARLKEDVEASGAYYAQAIARAREAGHEFGELRALVARGYLTMAHLSVSDALALFDEGVRIADSIGERLYLANALLGRAEAKDRLRRGSAQDDAVAAYSLFKRLRSAIGCGNAAERLASFRRAAGDLDGSGTYLREAAQWQQKSGDRVGSCNTLDRLGDVELSRGRPHDAARAFGTARELAARIPYPRGVVNADLGLAQCLLARGEWSKARSAFETVLEAQKPLNDLASIMKGFDGLAICAGQLAGPAGETAVRVTAVQELERLRAESGSAVVQKEYRIRFTEVYGAALRSAIRAQDSSSALYILECAAGRTLSGLMSRPEQVGDAPGQFWREAAALADQRLSGRWTPDTPQDRRQRLVRLLGANAILGTSREQVSDQLAEVAASFFLPLSLGEVEELIDDVPAQAWCVVVALDLHAGDELAVYARDPHGATWVHTHPITAHMRDWLTGGQSGAIEFGRAVLPEALREAADVDLLVVPIGEAWRIPWAALPVSDTTVLGEHARITVTPSLTMHRVLGRRTPRGTAGRRCLWRNPTLLHMRFDNWDGMDQLGNSDELIQKLQDPTAEVVAIVAHGRGHGANAYLELDIAKPLPMTSLLDTGIAGRVALIACKSAVQRDEMPAYDDPLTFATLALVAGADEVLATCSDLADSPQATMFVRSVLGNRGASFAAAVQQSTKILLSSSVVREGSVLHWAPLITVGVVHGQDEEDDSVGRDQRSDLD